MTGAVCAVRDAHAPPAPFAARESVVAGARGPVLTFKPVETR